MPFGTITSQTVSYEPRQPGVYSRTGLTFDQPANEYRVRGASKAGKGASPVSATVTRYLQKDLTVGTNTTRVNAIVSLSIQLPATGGFSPSELDSLVEDISVFITPQNVSRLLQGES